MGSVELMATPDCPGSPAGVTAVRAPQRGLLGEILLREGLVTRAQLDAALQACGADATQLRELGTRHGEASQTLAAFQAEHAALRRAWAESQAEVLRLRAAHEALEREWRASAQALSELRERHTDTVGALAELRETHEAFRREDEVVVRTLMEVRAAHGALLDAHQAALRELDELRPSRGAPRGRPSRRRARALSPPAAALSRGSAQVDSLASTRRPRA